MTALILSYQVDIDPPGYLPVLSLSFRLIVLAHYIHLRGCYLPLDVLRLLLEGASSREAAALT